MADDMWGDGAGFDWGDWYLPDIPPIDNPAPPPIDQGSPDFSVPPDFSTPDFGPISPDPLPPGFDFGGANLGIVPGSGFDPFGGVDLGLTGGLEATQTPTGILIRNPNTGEFFRVNAATGRLERIAIGGYDQATGRAVIIGPNGEVVADLSKEQIAEISAAAQGGMWDRVKAGTAEIERFLGTNTGGALTALGLGALGIGLGRAAAGGTPPAFQPQQRFQSIAANPAAIALEQEIRMRNLQALANAGAGGVSDAMRSGDPITVDLTTRLRKALAGEVSNPILARADLDERARLDNTMARQSGSPLWRDSSSGIEKTQRLDESQAIRRYLDNMQTIAALEPRIASRQAAETARLSDLSGLATMNPQRNYEEGLANQYAYNAYLLDRQDRASLANTIGQVFGTAAGTIGRRPWDQYGLVNLGGVRPAG